MRRPPGGNAPAGIPQGRPAGMGRGIGGLARIFTAERDQRRDRDHLIDVRLPALADTGNTDLEQRISLEIKKRMDDVLDEAEERARETREACVETGGTEEEFIPIIIDVDYEVKRSSGRYLSFLIWKTETLAGAYTEVYAHNPDLTVGKEPMLRDIPGPDFRAGPTRSSGPKWTGESGRRARSPPVCLTEAAEKFLKFLHISVDKKAGFGYTNSCPV